jgi:ectoine hydroxylase-related dioxygenase (phytanoyl-CoA dioxygenase family)
LRLIAESLLGSHSIAVRAVLFDKTPQRNWKIHWHQDSIIAVRERRNAPGFVGWSQKDGVWHVQPPAEILADMVALRIHLDDASSENGPLRVLPGSHRVGWIEEKDLPQWRERVPEVVLPARTGDVLAMKPLLLHASAPSQNAHHRRVVHVEFACRDLPAGLTWFEQW